MIGIIKDSFKITNNYLIIATPLILFSLLSSLYLIFSSGGSSLGMVFSIILFFLMLCAFLSGWFYMIVKAVKDSDMEEKDKLLTEFPSGVGEYFLSVIGMLILSIILSILIMLGAMIIGKKYIGDAGITQSQLISATANVDAMKSFANSLTTEQLLKINKWNILVFITLLFNYFILMFYNPVIFFKNKNPFIAFFVSLKDLFSRHFFKNLTVFALIVITYMILSILSVLGGSNMFLHFIMTLVNFYYVTFAVIFVFNYYYQHYAKIGAVIDQTV